MGSIRQTYAKIVEKECGLTIVEYFDEDKTYHLVKTQLLRLASNCSYSYCN